MRRVLREPPKGIRYEVIGSLTRATINASEAFMPFEFVPYRPSPCPVCGEDAGNVKDRIPTVVSLEYSGAETMDLMAWSHSACFESCKETDEPNRDME